jgi:hypothetical protein
MIHLFLSLKRSDLLDVANDLLGVFGDCVEVPSRDGSLVEQRSDKANRSSTILKILSCIVQINTTRRIDFQEGEGRADGLDPIRTSHDAGKEFLKGCTVSVCGNHFRGGLASWSTNDVALSTPFDNVRKHDRSDDEFTSGFHSISSILRAEDSSASDHNVTVVFGAEIREVLQAVRSGQGELNNLEASVYGRLHSLGASRGCRRTKDGTGPVVGKAVKDGLVVFTRAFIVKARSGTCHAPSADSAGQGTRGGDSKRHSCNSFSVSV